jgi:hypothetical protein
MAGNIHGQSSQTIRSIVERIFNTGQLSRLEHLQLVSAFLAEYKITDDERNQINRVFDDLQTGRLKILD